MEQFDFSGIEHLIVDEADKMFEMGFLDQVAAIFDGVEKNKETQCCKYLFSATMQPGIE